MHSSSTRPLQPSSDGVVSIVAIPPKVLDGSLPKPGHSTPGFELAARGLARVGDQVVALAEGVEFDNEIARDLITLRKPACTSRQV